MAKLNIRTSIKHLQIDKANSLMLIAAAVTTAMVVFSAIAVNAFYKQIKYQNKVIGLRNKANKQLETNIKSVNLLMNSYQAFEGSGESVIGTADKNSKVVLNALPSKYDFPALATSLQGIIAGSGTSTVSITGTDAEATAKQDSATPVPIEIPFTFSAKGNYANIQKLIVDLQRSIRPMQIVMLSFSGSDDILQVDITGKTYYQPEKTLGIQQSVVPGPSKTTSATISTGATK